MIRLDFSREPRRLDLGHGVAVTVRPATSALMMAARRAASARPEIDNDERITVLVKAIGRLAITAWEGVGDANGDPVEPSPERIEALLDLWPFAEAFQRLYVGPALLLDEEKKRIRALADWHFGGGARYCSACERECPKCPTS
jgi:hypothetical protein